MLSLFASRMLGGWAWSGTGDAGSVLAVGAFLPPWLEGRTPHGQMDLLVALKHRRMDFVYLLIKAGHGMPHLFTSRRRQPSSRWSPQVRSNTGLSGKPPTIRVERAAF